MLNKKSLENINWRLASLARKTLSLCSSLDSISFCHIPLEWNRAADCLAKWASGNVYGWNINGRFELPLEYREIVDQLLLEDRNI